MKRMVLLLLTGVALNADAQYVCKVYQCAANDEAHRRPVLTKRYDEQGRILKETVGGYCVYLDNTSTMYCLKEEGVYEHFYDDSILYKTVVTFYDDQNRRPADSDKVFYYYNETNGKLKNEVTAKHLKKRIAGKKPGSFRTNYQYSYDERANVVARVDINGEGMNEYLSYDDFGRVLVDSNVRDEDHYTIVIRYEYFAGGYREYEWSADRKYPVIKVYKQDARKNILEQSTWFHSNEGKAASKRISTRADWHIYIGKDLNNFREQDRTEMQYDSDGRLMRSVYFYKGKHTTTHYYEYE